MRKRLGLTIPLAIAGLAALACSDSDPVASGSGQLRVQLTDAPFPFSEVKSVDIFIVRVDGKMAETDSAEAADGDNGWTTLFSPNTEFDLLTLTGGQTADLGTVSLPAG